MPRHIPCGLLDESRAVSPFVNGGPQDPAIAVSTEPLTFIHGFDPARLNYHNLRNLNLVVRLGKKETTTLERLVIVVQPTDQSSSIGLTASFTVMAAGPGSLTHQWSENGAVVPGATSASYNTPILVSADDGSDFTVTVSDSVTSVDSNPATLTVEPRAPQGGDLRLQHTLPRPILVVVSTTDADLTPLFQRGDAVMGYLINPPGNRSSTWIGERKTPCFSQFV